MGELESHWHRHLKVRFSWIPIITGTTALWFLLALIFLLAYGKKRRAKGLIFEQRDSAELDT